MDYVIHAANDRDLFVILPGCVRIPTLSTDSKQSRCHCRPVLLWHAPIICCPPAMQCVSLRTDYDNLTVRSCFQSLKEILSLIKGLIKWDLFVIVDPFLTNPYNFFPVQHLLWSHTFYNLDTMFPRKFKLWTYLKIVNCIDIFQVNPRTYGLIPLT